MQEQRILPARLPAPTRRNFGIEIVRPRVLDALERSDAAPVRMLCAPHGAGKTSALFQYASRHRDVGVVTLPPQASRAQVIACLERLSPARLTIIDQADAASPSGHDALFERIEANWPHGSCYLLSGSSRTKMRVQPLMACGIADMFDASLLPFTSGEIGDLAAMHGVAANEMDIEQLSYDTDGWPVAVSWIIRDAARNGRPLRGAFEQWRELNDHLLLEFVTASHHDAESSDAFVSAIWSLAHPATQRTLDRLEADGYPIVRMRASLRPYRVLMRTVDDAPATTRAELTDRRLILKLFGRFSCSIANQPVVFDRRRDQNVLTYVALAPGATVTRAEFLAAFWPNASRSVALQGLRTTLCRLRRAISDAAGCDADRYIRVDNSITLDPDWVSIDARSFKDYIELAETEDANGNRSAARDHYRRAERLHIGALLASEALEPQLASRAAEYNNLFNLVLARLVDVNGFKRNARREPDPWPE